MMVKASLPAQMALTVLEMGAIGAKAAAQATRYVAAGAAAAGVPGAATVRVVAAAVSEEISGGIRAAQDLRSRE